MNNSIPAINSILRNGIKEYIEEKSGPIKAFNRYMEDEIITPIISFYAMTILNNKAVFDRIIQLGNVIIKYSSKNVIQK